MSPRVPSYEKAIRFQLLALIAGYILQRVAFGASSTVAGILTGISSVMLLVCLYAAYKFYRELKAGFLFPLRTISYYLGIISVIIGVVWLIYEITSGSPKAPEALMWVAVLTGSFVLSMPYVYLDSVRLEHRLGFTVTVLPLFGIQRIDEEDDRMLIRGKDGLEITVFEGQLGSAHYNELRTRVIAIK